MPYLPAFTPAEFDRAKRLLATQVAAMMGRKLEEGDWSRVYCAAKGIPEAGWSNLHIDVNHDGLGLELKLLRISGLNGRPLKSVCGTTLMHPAATRSIRIDNPNNPAEAVKESVLAQYSALIVERTRKVQAAAPGSTPDMRTGWLIWEDSLTEFLYFEEPMIAPQSSRYFAEWNVTPARGARKASKSLWVYDKRSKQKRYSVTTTAGAKIQPYFDVPPPSDPNLYYFRVQGELVDYLTVRLWISSSTARALRSELGSLDRSVISDAASSALRQSGDPAALQSSDESLAEPILIDKSVYDQMISRWDAVSDEHRAQILLRCLRGSAAGDE